MNKRFLYLGEMLSSYNSDCYNTADIYALYSKIAYTLHSDECREMFEALELLKRLVVEEVMVISDYDFEGDEMIEEEGLDTAFQLAMHIMGYKNDWNLRE